MAHFHTMVLGNDYYCIRPQGYELVSGEHAIKEDCQCEPGEDFLIREEEENPDGGPTLIEP